MGSELFPITEGFVLGLFLAWTKPRDRLRIGAPIALALGALATLVSGEFRLNWGFLLVDIPLVVLSSAVALRAFHRWGRARAAARLASQ